MTIDKQNSSFNYDFDINSSNSKSKFIIEERRRLVAKLWAQAKTETESWIDTENGGKGHYKKVHEFIDNGNWGDAMKICGAKTNGQAITWGSPIVIIKANDFKFDIYDVEIREIIPPNS